MRPPFATVVEELHEGGCRLDYIRIGEPLYGRRFQMAWIDKPIVDLARMEHPTHVTEWLRTAFFCRFGAGSRTFDTGGVPLDLEELIA